MIRTTKLRFTVFIIFFAALSIILIIRYFLLMTGRNIPPALVQSQVFLERGPILDRNGRFLALQTNSSNVSIWRPGIENLETLCAELSPILEMPADEIQERIQGSASDFLYLKKQADESVTRLISAALAEGGIRGVSLEPAAGRIYPEKNHAGHILGFVGNENSGLAGIEFAFDAVLSGNKKNGGRGSQVVLTIDSNVQHILEQIAAKTMRENQAEAVMFIAMDPRTGDILGSASLPGFDPNNFQASSELERMDRPALWAYEPGSVFKVFSLSALMDCEAITGSTAFVCNGYYQKTSSRGESVQIGCLGAHGRVTAREIIIYSCNAGAAYASDHLENTAFYDLLRGYGFGSRTGVVKNGETAGFLRPAGRWSDRTRPTIAIGQEIAVSAMQMIQAASAIANDGALVPPRLVLRIVSADGRDTQKWESGKPRMVLKPETARAMRSYMVDVSSSIGTGWRASVEDLSLAVKTGTAQTIDPVTKAYSDTDYIASCIALLPAETPSLILYLAIIKPRGEILGGRIAAPAIREAAEALVDYLGIPRGRNAQIIHPSSITLPSGELPYITDKIPNFYGFSKRSLIPLLLRDDLHFDLRGDGWVRRQNPASGTPLTPDTVIVLELE
jgi:cell division protein FtsI (penicillin-binding protein 3)